jgi:hypothetical protein
MAYVLNYTPQTQFMIGVYPAVCSGSFVVYGSGSVGGYGTISGSVVISGSGMASGSPISGSGILAGTISVYGTGTISGSPTISGSMNMTGPQAVAGSAMFYGTAIYSGSIGVSGLGIISGSATCGAGYITGSGTISGSASVAGSITVGGSSAFYNATAMYYIEQGSDTAAWAAPHWSYKAYSKQIVNGAGLVMGMGWALGSWDWDVIGQPQRDWLRNFIPGQSAEIWVNTKTLDNAEGYVPFHVVAVWPIDTEVHDAHRRTKLSITMQRMTTT